MCENENTKKYAAEKINVRIKELVRCYVPRGLTPKSMPLAYPNL